MEYRIYWSVLAKDSFNDEVDFIFRKWNFIEVTKFIALVDDVIVRGGYRLLGSMICDRCHQVVRFLNLLHKYTKTIKIVLSIC